MDGNFMFLLILFIIHVQMQLAGYQEYDNLTVLTLYGDSYQWLRIAIQIKYVYSKQILVNLVNDIFRIRQFQSKKEKKDEIRFIQ